MISNPLCAGFRSLTRELIDFVFPPLCVSCGERILDLRNFLCMACFGAIARASTRDTLYCEISERLCHDGLIDGLIVPFYFDKGGPLQTMVHVLKYRGLSRVGVTLGMEIGRELLLRADIPPIQALLPIPLHRAKMRERGYNQAEELCRGIRDATGIPVEQRVLERRCYTKTQTTLTREERERNVMDAFRIRHNVGDHLGKASVLLVDDIITTGATMRASARALRDGGVRNVYAASIAIARQMS